MSHSRMPLTVIILGNTHVDFTLYPALIKIFNELHQKNIPLAYMEEGPSDQKLAQTVESNQRGIKQTGLIKMLAPEIHDHYTKDPASKRLYLKKSVYNSIEKIVEEKFMPFVPGSNSNPGMLKLITMEVYRENAYNEELLLYKKLQALKIYFAGIDAPTHIYNEKLTAAAGDEQAYLNNEQFRIDTMVKNILNNSQKALPQGGIIFVSTGDSHSHRLGANLIHQASLKNIPLTTQIYSYRSSFVTDWDDDRDYALKLTKDIDSAEIKALYTKHPKQHIKCLEEKGKYSIPELEKFIQKTISLTSLERSMASLSFFDKSSSIQQQLIKEIKPTQANTGIIKAIEEKNYSLALRKACAAGDCQLIPLLLKYSDKLPIDVSEASSNGNTPLLWLEASKASASEKEEMKRLLEEHMGKNAKQTLP